MVDGYFTDYAVSFSLGLMVDKIDFGITLMRTRRYLGGAAVAGSGRTLVTGIKRKINLCSHFRSHPSERALATKLNMLNSLSYPTHKYSHS